MARLVKPKGTGNIFPGPTFSGGDLGGGGTPAHLERHRLLVYAVEGKLSTNKCTATLLSLDPREAGRKSKLNRTMNN